MSDWPRFETPPRVAFLDVDGTLLAETTTYLFARILHRRGMLRRSFVLRAMYHGLQHRFGRLDYGQLIAFGLKNLGDVPVVELERIAYENFAEYVKPRLYEGVAAHFDELRRSGTRLVLVSSSPGIVIEPLKLYLGCTEALTTPVKIEKGRLVDVGEGPACYGEGKLYWARKWAGEQGIGMDSAAAYADNWSDRALLQEVGRPIVVGPRGRLRRLARDRGWTVVRPRRPGRRGQGRPLPPASPRVVQ